jgi:hypothetical protein
MARATRGRIGSYTAVTWTAFSLTEKNSIGGPLVVASASKLESLKERLAAYLADKTAGAVKHYSKYGVFNIYGEALPADSATT